MRKSFILLALILGATILLLSNVSALSTRVIVSGLSGTVSQQFIPYLPNANAFTNVTVKDITNLTYLNWTFVPLNASGDYYNSTGFMIRIENLNANTAIVYLNESTTGTSHGSNATAVYGNNLVSYWAFEEMGNISQVYDLNGKANGTAGGGFTRINTHNGNDSRGIQFDGSSHTNVSFDNNGNTALNFTGDITIYSLSNQTSDGEYTYAQDCGTTTGQACIGLTYTTGTTTQRLSITSWNNTQNNAMGIQTNTGILATNTWYSESAGWTYNKAIVTKNGVNETSGSNLANIAGAWKPANGVAPYIAERANDGQRFTGQIGEMGIWNRMLSLNELSYLSNQTSGGATFSVDGTATLQVNVTSLSPANNSYNNTANVFFNATINVTAGSFNNATLQIWFTNGTLAYQNNSVVNPFVGIWQHFTTFLDGTYLWNILGFGNSSTASAQNYSQSNFTITIDTTAPTGSQNSNSDADGIYVNRNFVISNVSFSDATSGVSFANTSLYNASGSLQYIANATSSPLYANFSGLTDGNYSRNTTIFDNAGNKNQIGTRSIVIDTTLPVPAFGNGTDINGSTVSRSWFILNATYSDLNAQSMNISLWNSSGSLINSTLSVSSPLWLNFTNLTKDTYAYNITALDKAGNTNFTATQSITISPPLVIQDNTIPFVNITSGAPAEYQLQLAQLPWQVSFTTNASDNALAYQWYYVLNGNGSIYLVNTTTTTGNFTIVFDHFDTYTLGYSANDTTGNTNITTSIIKIYTQGISGNAATGNAINQPINLGISQGQNVSEIAAQNNQSLTIWLQDSAAKYGITFIIIILLVVGISARRKRR